MNKFLKKRAQQLAIINCVKRDPNKMFEISKRNLISIVILICCYLVILRPLTFLYSGDAEIYFKGARQILSGIDVYGINREPFGSRFFNGPLFGIFHIPFLIVPEIYRLPTYRLILLLSTFFAIRITLKVFPGKNRPFFIYTLLLLLYPSRMSINLAQGAAIAYLAALLSMDFLRKSEERKKFHLLIVASVLLIFSCNYKPLLILPFILYLFFNKKFLFLFSAAFIQLMVELSMKVFGLSAGTGSWFILLYERSSRIESQGSTDIVGPFALLGKYFHFATLLTFFIPLLAVIFLSIHFSRSPKIYDDKKAIVLLSTGCFLGPYSPGQDSLMLSVLTIVIALSYRPLGELGSKFSVFLFALILAFWSLPTQGNFKAHLLLIVLISFFLSFTFGSRLNWKKNLIAVVTFVLSSLVLRTRLSVPEVDHSLYDVSGVANLLIPFFLVVTMHRKRKLDNV